MNRNRTLFSAALAVAGVAASWPLVDQSRGQDRMTVEELSRSTHVHGIAVDAADPSRLLLATHHGLFIAKRDGTVEQVSEQADDFMGFTPHPADGSVLYASGHPGPGGNLGLIESGDGGRTWHRLSEGAAEYGPVDFHVMDISKADPSVIYGVYRELQVSRDGGRNWQVVDVPPRRMIDLAASAKDPDTIYAATESGLYISQDGGRSWQATKLAGKPVALIHIDADARMLAFVVGTGLMRSTEGSPKWEKVGGDFGDRILLHLATDPSDPHRLYAVSQDSAVLQSLDGGQNWSAFGGGNL